MNIIEIFNIPPFVYWFLVCAVIIFFVFISLKTASSKKSTSKYNYTKKKFLISRAEHEFYDALSQAVGNDFHIFVQVHLPTLIDHKVKGQNWQGALSHISRKSVDFVLCDKSHISPVLAIELDDKSHLSEERQKRDGEVERILSEAGLPLLRIENHGSFDPANIAANIKQKLALS